ncbi:MAG: SCO family protein [Anaerolineae bacterium]|nr:SCO family protein [Anaerolineae bacterium]
MQSGAIKQGKWLNYVVIGVLIVALFFVGVKIGGAVSGAATTTTNTQNEAANLAPGGALVNPPTAISNFTLTDQNGQPLSMTALHGKAVVLFFGYTHCPDVCPSTLADYTRVKKLLGTDADKVTFVLVSVDAERDTPAVMKDYLKNFDTSFVGLTSDDATLRKVATQFGATYAIPEHNHGDEHSGHTESVQSDNYFVEHTSPSFLIDANGTLRMVYFNGAAPEDMVKGIHNLITM